MTAIRARDFLLALLVILYPGTASATFFVAGFSSDYAVVATDSRMILGNVVSDKYCKIRPLSKNAFFFARGSTSAYDDEIRKNVFDARDIAASAFSAARSDNPLPSDLARGWAERMLAIYEKRPREFAREAVDGLMAEGFFVGLGEGGTVALAGEAIRYKRQAKSSFAAVSEPVLPSDPREGPKYISGHQEIIKEFNDGGKTKRAKKMLARLDANTTGPDAVAARYSLYVEAVRDWARDSGIGGEVATIILEKGKGWRWFRRPNYCPEK